MRLLALVRVQGLALHLLLMLELLHSNHVHRGGIVPGVRRLDVVGAERGSQTQLRGGDAGHLRRRLERRGRGLRLHALVSLVVEHRLVRRLGLLHRRVRLLRASHRLLHHLVRELPFAPPLGGFAHGVSLLPNRRVALLLDRREVFAALHDLLPRHRGVRPGAFHRGDHLRVRGPRARRPRARRVHRQTDADAPRLLLDGERDAAPLERVARGVELPSEVVQLDAQDIRRRGVLPRAFPRRRRLPARLRRRRELRRVLGAVHLEPRAFLRERRRLARERPGTLASRRIRASFAGHRAPLRLRRHLRVAQRPRLLLRGHLRLAARERLLLPRASRRSLRLLLQGGFLRVAEGVVLRREPLAVVVRRPLERRLRGSHALHLALLPRAEFPQALGVHALELLPGVRELAPVLRGLLQARLAHLVLAHAPDVFLHLLSQPPLALLLERRHAFLGVAQRGQALHLHRALVHLVDLLHSESQGAPLPEIVRLRLHLAARVLPAHVREALEDLHEKGGAVRRLRRVGGDVSREVVGDGAAEGEDARELLARHHLRVRQPALGLEHGQGVAVVLRREVLDVQAVRRALPQRLLRGAAALEHVRVAALQDADQARAQRALQAVDRAGALELIEHLALELAIRKRDFGRHRRERPTAAGEAGREDARAARDVGEKDGTPNVRSARVAPARNAGVVPPDETTSRARGSLRREGEWRTEVRDATEGHGRASSGPRPNLSNGRAKPAARFQTWQRSPGSADQGGKRDA